MHFDTFLFDLDGTLTDSLPDLTAALNLLRGEMALPPLTRETVRGYVGDGASILLQRALPEGLFSDERLTRFLALYGEHLAEQTSVYPGIREFLELHRERRMAVVTNKPLALARGLLEALDLLRYFPVVIGPDGDRKKPHPGPLLAALDRLGTGPASAVMIGDHHTDLRAGRAAGMRVCFCAWGFGNDGGEPGDFFAATPSDLPRLFPAEPR
ncbi:MAG: HAD family hydrolase [Desulfuromonas sp.]|uniref:HAD family hydrolase n=1 Tax=Desulfuromonas sp. TaxID=892 RepID=UPI000CBD4283|nr:HAD-IA family hydrolase [Desulfuromonas sp.]PLX86630.1 MAG: HAD family hydrolase [Desulfuromonas sp.]